MFQVNEELNLILHVKEGVDSGAEELGLGKAFVQIYEKLTLILMLGCESSFRSKEINLEP